MESVLTVRIDGDMKDRASEVMRREGYTPSSAVRSMFDYIVKHDAMPFSQKTKLSQDEMIRRIAAFDSVHTKQPLTLTDEELRDERLRSRYGLDA